MTLVIINTYVIFGSDLAMNWDIVEMHFSTEQSMGAINSLWICKLIWIYSYKLKFVVCKFLFCEHSGQPLVTSNKDTCIIFYALQISMGVWVLCRKKEAFFLSSHIFWLFSSEILKRYFWAHLCLCTVGSYASLSVCLSVCLSVRLWLDQNSD